MCSPIQNLKPKIQNRYADGACESNRSCGQRRIRTSVGRSPTGLQPVPIVHSGICPGEPTVRFELTASCLQNSCSATELRRHTESLRWFFRCYSLYSGLLFSTPFLRTGSYYTVCGGGCQANLRATALRRRPPGTSTRPTS